MEWLRSKYLLRQNHEEALKQQFGIKLKLFQFKNNNKYGQRIKKLLSR